MSTSAFGPVERAAPIAQPPSSQFGAVETPRPSASSSPFGAIERAVSQQPERALDFSLGRELAFAHKHPVQALTNVLGTGQRALEAAETGGDIWGAITHPQEAEALHKAVRAPMTTADWSRGLVTPLRALGAGVGELERGPLAGTAGWQKFARGALDVPFDVLDDPLSAVPVGDAFKGAELLGRGLKAMNPELVANAGKVLADAGEWLRNTKIGQLLDPESELRPLKLTDQEHNMAMTIAQRTMANERNDIADSLKVLRSSQAAIRAGDMPIDMARRFHNPSNIPTTTNPFDVESALHEDARGFWRDKMTDFSQHPDVMQAYMRGDIRRDLVEKGAQAAVPKNFYTESPILKLVQQMTHRGNQAFLALPFPHGGNLAALSYLRYGAATTLKGLGYAAQLATGKISPDLARGMQTLAENGRQAHWADIFTEMRPNIMPALGKVTVPLERGSNWMQRKFLNPLDNGLRVAALEAETKSGIDLGTALTNIDRNFGTDPATGIVRAGSMMGEGFSKFHLQTSPYAGLRALAKRPDRVAAMLKMQQDFNRQFSPGGAQYRGTVPGLAVARQVMDPWGYWSSVLGPVGTALGPYSPVGMLQKGKVAEALEAELSRYIPANQLGPVIAALMQGRGTQAAQELAPALVGGYYKKGAMPP